MRSEEFNESFVTAVLEADATTGGGIPIRRRSSSASRAGEIESIRMEIKEIERKINGAQNMAEMAAGIGDLDSARTYEASRQDHVERLRGLEVRLEDSQQRSRQAKPHGDGSADFGSLAAVLAALRKYPDQAPPELGDALRSLIVEIAFDVHRLLIT